MKYDCVILANGDFPTHRIPLEVLHGAKFLCCCDGAAQTAIEHGLQPDAIIGDGDSLSAEVREEYQDVLHVVSEQEDNDQTKATRYCASRGFVDIAYIGATGKREDHTLGNIALMMRYYRQMNIEPLMLTDYGWFVAAEGRQTFDSFAGQQVSIFSFNTTRLTSEGLRWSAYSYEELWQGTLNESLGTRFTLDADGCYLVYRTYDAK